MAIARTIALGTFSPLLLLIPTSVVSLMRSARLGPEALGPPSDPGQERERPGGENVVQENKLKSVMQMDWLRGLVKPSARAARLPQRRNRLERKVGEYTQVQLNEVFIKG